MRVGKTTDAPTLVRRENLLVLRRHSIRLGMTRKWVGDGLQHPLFNQGCDLVLNEAFFR